MVGLWACARHGIVEREGWRPRVRGGRGGCAWLLGATANQSRDSANSSPRQPGHFRPRRTEGSLNGSPSLARRRYLTLLLPPSSVSCIFTASPSFSVLPSTLDPQPSPLLSPSALITHLLSLPPLLRPSFHISLSASYRLCNRLPSDAPLRARPSLPYTNALKAPPGATHLPCTPRNVHLCP